MAKSATKMKPPKQPDLFDAPARGAKPAARKSSGRKAPKAAKPAARPKSRGGSAEAGYTAKHIEVLEGLEPVRRRPGMYIGGTDEKALHHLFAEVIDNSMDEALAGHATWIEVEMEANGFVSVTDNGRGIPVDPHPKFKNKSALEVIMCTLHAGGKFDSKVYETSGGLHGVGVSVANALSERMEVEVAREQTLYRMAFERGKPKGKLRKSRPRAKPARHQDPLPPRSGDFRGQGRVQGRARVQDGALEGLSVRRRRDPLALRQGAAQGRRGRAGEGDLPFRRRAEGLSRRQSWPMRRWCIPTSSPARPARPARMARSNGRWPGPRTPTASCNPTATPSRRRTAARMNRACAARCCAG